MFIFLDIGGEYMTRMMDIFDFLRSRGRNGKNNLGNNKIIVGLIFHSLRKKFVEINLEKVL